MKYRQTHSVEVAAAKRYNYHLRAKRRVDVAALIPSEPIFETEVVPLLKAAPGIRAVAVYNEMLRRHPELPERIRRTLERRIRS